MKTLSSQRGSVLAQVLILGILMALLSAGLLQMVMHRATVGAQTQGGVQARGSAEEMLAKVNSAWNSASTGVNVGRYCVSDANVSCSGGASTAPNPCVCTVSGAPAGSYVYFDGTKMCACSPKFRGFGGTENCPATIAGLGGACP